MKTTIRCAWCGQEFPPTKKGRPKQHFNGAQVCVGSGFTKEVHEELRTANAPRKQNVKTG